MKICTKCNEQKSLIEYPKDKTKKDGVHTQCKVCHRERNKNKRLTDPVWREKANAKSAAYRSKFPDKNKQSIRNATLKAKYGITSKQYEELFKNQGYCCAVCGRKESKGYGKMPVDHNHVTGKVRGILCQPCNVTLGKVEEKEEILLSLIKYLRKNKE